MFIGFHETWVERPMRVWRWVVLRCSLQEGIQMHMVFACPILNPRSHRNPCTPRALSFLLKIVINN